MNRLIKHTFLWILVLGVFPPVISVEADSREWVHHEMDVVLDPDRHHIEVTDRITLPASWVSGTDRNPRFVLHGNLNPRSETEGVTIRQINDTGQSASNDSRIDGHLGTETYVISLPSDQNRFTLQYQGSIYHPHRSLGSGEAETPGTIMKEGIFLAGSTQWYPWFNDEPVTFSLNTQTPKPWITVSQGTRTINRDEGKTTVSLWISPNPQDEIYLIGGRFTEYSRSDGPVQVMAFLRSPDPELAGRYLEAGISYIKMYSDLLGPYPYSKFALIENFLETGYGMPSFTLLGSTVIRLPFILHSSYPHEILHNWWGNGVYVDYANGNWSEGLTSYLADHLVKEQQGTGPEHRRAVLQNYTDYVAGGKDFPLTAFRARHSRATAAVGYGKTLMFFHMLRRQLGDDVFIRGLRRFYEQNRFRRAGFEDLRAAFTAVSGKDLKMEFGQWVDRTGAPALRLGTVRVRKVPDGFVLSAILEQVQPGPAYTLQVPIAVHLEGHEKTHQTQIAMTQKRVELSLSFPDRPLRLAVDPEFDLFRRLDRAELPPALTQSFGAGRTLILIPSGAKEPDRDAYRIFAEAWQRSQPGSIQIRMDAEFEELPSDRAVWILGWENRFATDLNTVWSAYPLTIQPDGIQVSGKRIGKEDHVIVLTARHPDNPDSALNWIAADNMSALPGLARKLPHYGRYSYLAFKGEQPSNVLKGQWEVLDSPMSFSIPLADGSLPKATRAQMEPRRALTD